MAVEAMVFASDFGYRGMDELQIVNQDAGNLLQLGSNLGSEGGKLLMQQQARQIVLNPTMLSDRKSELTCNESHPGKRARVESVALPCHNQITATHPFTYISAPPKGAGVGVHELLVQSRLQESCGVSTSGRQALTPQPVSSTVHDLVSLLYQQNLEVDSLVRLQNERLRCELEEMCNRHYRAFLSVCGQQAAKQLMEKETGLQSALLRNVELEEKIRLMSAENQLWFNMAKNNEAIVSNLRTTLEQALHERVANRETNVMSCDLGAEDAQSCCYEADNAAAAAAPAVESRRAKACKVCCEKDVCMLLLPCRHLCLCKVCESVAVACPVCGAIKNSRLQVFMC
ncbi:BOI-related E3 ubiquitin-protein ligase 1-like [Zingiber officinale]|nr:BOI-related E3 ubiquitin-protein ligase 1-like [Zingiber officinale]